MIVSGYFDLTNCKNCGAPIEIGSDKCPYCGTGYLRNSQSGDRSIEVLFDEAVVSGAISINEARKIMGFEPLYDPEKWRVYR